MSAPVTPIISETLPEPSALSSSSSDPDPPAPVEEPAPPTEPPAPSPQKKSQRRTVRASALENLFLQLGEERFQAGDFLYTFLMTYRYFTKSTEVIKALKNVYSSQNDSSQPSDESPVSRGTAPLNEYIFSYDDQATAAGNESCTDRSFKEEEEFLSGSLADRESNDEQARATLAGASLQSEDSLLAAVQLPCSEQTDDSLCAEGIVEDDSPLNGETGATFRPRLYQAKDQRRLLRSGSASESALKEAVDKVCTTGSNSTLRSKRPKSMVVRTRSDPLGFSNEITPFKPNFDPPMSFSGPQRNSLPGSSSSSSLSSSSSSSYRQPSASYSGRMPSAVPGTSPKTKLSMSPSLTSIDSAIRKSRQMLRRKLSGTATEMPLQGSPSLGDIGTARDLSYEEANSSAEFRPTSVPMGITKPLRRKPTADSLSAKSYSLDEVTPRGGSEEPSDRRNNTRCSPLTLRVFNILKQWVKTFPEDFGADTETRAMTMEFIEDVIENSSSADAALARNLQRSMISLANNPAVVPVENLLPRVPVTSDLFLTFRYQAVAEQLTLTTHKIFCQIKQSELCKQAWKRPNKDVLAPTISALIERCNWLHSWVFTEVTHGKTAPKRAEALEKVIRIAYHCLELHNLNDSLTMFYSLQNSILQRLTKTWKLIPSKVKGMVEDLEKVAKLDDRFLAMRTYIHACEPPCMPLIAAYLDMIYVIDFGMPTFDDSGFVNFGKMVRLSKQVRELIQFKQDQYTTLEDDPAIKSYLANLDVVLNEDHYYKLSLQHEPRTETG